MAYDFNSLPRFYAVDWATFSGSTASKNPNSIYVITDLGLIYKGDTLATKGVQVLTADIAASEAIPGILYYSDAKGLYTVVVKDGVASEQPVGTTADTINSLIDDAIDSLTVNGNTFGAAGACEVGADDIKMDGYVTVEGSTIGISSDSSITEAVTKLEEKVITLGALSGDAGEAMEGIAERLQKVETATTVSVTGTADSSILNNYGTADAAEYKVRNEYLPDVAVKGVNVAEGMGKRINFIGNCAVIADANGNLTVRIGDNLNSGCFMVSNDGQTNGTATATYNVSPSSHTLANGTSATTWLKAADNTITIATAEEIHFDEPADGTSLGKFVATVGDKEYEFEIDLSRFNLSTGATTSSAVSFGTAPAVLTISDFGHEAKSADGATGYSGKISLVLNVEDMSFADGEIQVKLVQEGTAGAGELTLNKFYWLNDNATKASGTVTSVALSSISAKQLSGVVHLTAATVTYKANVSNVATPATQNASNSTITFTPNSWANNGSVNVNYNATTATATTTTLKTGVFTPTATVTAANINGSGSASAAVALSGAAKLSIDVTAAGTTNDLSEAFDTEARRLNDDKTAWDSSASLTTVNGLQVYKGTLVYPSVDFRTCNEGLTVTLNGSSKTIASGSQPNYSGLSGARSYVRKFTKSGAAMFSGKVTVKTSATIATAVSNGSFRVLVGKANGNWYNIGFGQAANAELDGTTANIGKSTSSFGTTSSFDFEFTDGAAADNVWVKIIMTSNVATVTEMSFA